MRQLPYAAQPSQEAAGQMRRSPHQFSSISSQSPVRRGCLDLFGGAHYTDHTECQATLTFSLVRAQLLWLARGYAVLDGPTFPIVAEGEDEPNDTYVEQLTAAGRAAVEELVRRGVTDPARVSVGGHSYGAFMTANLLAHLPNLFAAGIARRWVLASHVPCVANAISL